MIEPSLRKPIPRYKKPKVQGNLKIDGYYDANKGSFIQNIREK